MGFDAVNSFGKRRGEMLYEGKWKNLVKTGLRHIGLPTGSMKYDYAKTVKTILHPKMSGRMFILLFYPSGTEHLA